MARASSPALSRRASLPKILRRHPPSAGTFAFSPSPAIKSTSALDAISRPATFASSDTFFRRTFNKSDVGPMPRGKSGRAGSCGHCSLGVFNPRFTASRIALPVRPCAAFSLRPRVRLRVLGVSGVWWAISTRISSRSTRLRGMSRY